MTGQSEWVYETVDGYRIEGTRDSLKRLGAALVLAAFDMTQAAAACSMLEEETADAARARALETAVVVCYARAFTQSTLRQLPERAFAPKKGTDRRALHNDLLRLRKKVYAHTDEDSGRMIERVVRAGDGETLAYQETWRPLDRRLLTPIGGLCQTQSERFQLEATRIFDRVDVAGADGSMTQPTG